MLTEEERKERKRECDRRYDQRRRAEDPVKVNASKLAYYYRNAAKLNADRCTWDKTHPEQVWRKMHPIVWRLIVEKRRAAKYANTPIEDILTSTEWLAILAEANGHCAYCDKEAKLTMDHVIPLTKGGKHSKENVVPACAHCNSSKGNKTLEEWNAKRLTQVSN